MLWLMLIAASPLYAEDGAWMLAKMEQRLYERINQARAHPLETAASLGHDPEQLMAQLPDLGELLENGLPTLARHSALDQSAKAYSQDMLARNFYSHLSPEGQDYDQRIKAAGYEGVLYGESLGVLSFLNFIDPAAGADRLFENLFKDELNPAQAADRNILNPNFQEIGIGLTTGTLVLGGRAYNVYMVTCHFGARINASALEASQNQLFNLINQARQAPLEMAASMGISPETILAELPEFSDMLTQGLAPLQWDERLYQAAQSRVQEMLAAQAYLPERAPGVEQLLQAGYPPRTATAYTEVLPFTGYMDTDMAAWRMFEKLFRWELNPDNSGDRKILNPEVEELGFALAEGEIRTEANVSRAYLLAACFASSEVSNVELELLSLINQTRQDPVGMAEMLGLASPEHVANVLSATGVEGQSLPLLRLNPRLQMAAGVHARDMLASESINSVSIDGRTVEKRAAESGYEFWEVFEALEYNVFWQSHQSLDLSRAAFDLFKKLLSQELNQERPLVIMNPNFQEIGIGFVAGKADILAGICGEGVYLMVLDFGIPFHHE